MCVSLCVLFITFPVTYDSLWSEKFLHVITSVKQNILQTLTLVVWVWSKSRGKIPGKAKCMPASRHRLCATPWVKYLWVQLLTKHHFTLIAHHCSRPDSDQVSFFCLSWVGLGRVSCQIFIFEGTWGQNVQYRQLTLKLFHKWWQGNALSLMLKAELHQFFAGVFYWCTGSYI